MKDAIHRDSASAWKQLRTAGGLDITYRDEDLVDRLKNSLDENAASLEEALGNSSTDEFIRAFFQVVHPFVEIFRDILKFFNKAGEKEGQSQLQISITDDHIGLEDFIEFLTHLKSIKIPTDIPSVDSDGIWALQRIVSDYSYENDRVLPRSDRINKNADCDDVNSWIERYEEGTYLPLPKSVSQYRMGLGITDATNIVSFVIETIRIHCNPKDRSWFELYSEELVENSLPATALNMRTIAINETDHWVRTNILSLALLIDMSPEDREIINHKLQSCYSQYDRVRVEAVNCIVEIEKLLSLPVWRKRHELYGVWVATQLVQALESDGHVVELLHNNGEFQFRFREATLAIFETTDPIASLITERRTKSSNLVGRGRVNAVQPDFAFWRDDIAKCELIIEVKHYRNRSRRNFRDALIDYGRAHQTARIVLVNYGPTGDLFVDLPDDVADRSEMIGHLIPNNRSEIDRLYDIVRTQIGRPVIRPLANRIELEDCSTAVDCRVLFEVPSVKFEEFLAVGNRNVTIPTPVTIEPVSEFPERLGRGNLLIEFLRSCEPIGDIMRSRRCVVLLTNDFGILQLRSQSYDVEVLEEWQENHIAVVRVRPRK